MDYVSINRASASEARKEIVRARLIHHAVTRAHRHLEVHEVALTSEIQWRRKVEEDLTVRQQRQKRRLLQTRWMPVFFTWQLMMKMRRIVQTGVRVREDKRAMLKATLIIQRAIRRRIKKKYMMMLGPTALCALKYRVRRWVRRAGSSLEGRATVVLRKMLSELRANNRILTIVKVFTRKVCTCQRYVRAFLQGQQMRRLHMHHLWDEVTKDVIGATEKNAWMYRVLENSGAKAERCNKELKNMRHIFMHQLRYYKNMQNAFNTKLEAYDLIKDMGMDESFIKGRLGITELPEKPKYPLICHRKVMRKHVEDAVESCGIEDFVNVNLKEDLKERIDTLIEEMQDKMSRRLSEFLNQNTLEHPNFHCVCR